MVRQRGYAGFSYADLANAIGIRKASIHYYFPTKEDLGAVLIESYRERYDVMLAAIWQGSESAIARVAAYARLYREGLSEDQGCLCGVMACERDILPRRLREAIARFFEAHHLWLQRVLEAGTGGKLVRQDLDPAAQASLVLSALQGALMVWHLFGKAEGFDATVAALLKSLR
jgi:TetR/AcrR family transcriptional repressor of nem operon